MTYSLSSRKTLLPRSLKPGPYTVEADDAVKVDGETLPRRHPSASFGLRSEPEPGIATVYDILVQGAVKFDRRPAIGFRRVIDKHTEVKRTTDRSGQRVDKEWSYYELSDYEYISYQQFKQDALAAGSALRKLGLQKHDRVQICAATSPFWYTVAQGLCKTIAVNEAESQLTDPRRISANYSDSHSIRHTWRRRSLALFG
jgi:long-chain acyl-CoA synthetase